MKIKECLPKIIELLSSIDSKLSRAPDMAAPEPLIKEVEVVKEVVKEVPVVKEVEVVKKVEVVKEVPDAFSRALKPAQSFLHAVQKDTQIADILLHRHQQAGEAQQLTALIASAAQWERIEEIFDILAQRCKDRQTAATATELELLKQCVVYHNLIWRDKAAELCPIAVGKAYDFKLHNRANAQGDTITAEWLPELRNAGNQVSRKALVETE